MNDKEIAEFIDLLYPYFLKKIKADGAFKTCVRSTNATVTNVGDGETNINSEVRVKLPYDPSEISVINKSTSELKKGDLVCIHYCIDLKNAYVAYKV